MILCCGEALIDMIPSISQSGEPGFTPHCGGAVFNTAIAMGRLGTRTEFLSGLSSDLFGDQLRHALAESNVATSLVITSNLPTTLAFVQLANGHANYTFYDENSAGRNLLKEQLPSVPDDVAALFFGGICLINEPCAEFYSALAIQESASKVIAIDPNIRADFVQDENRYRARLDSLIKHADIVKVSDEDLNWILPQNTPLNDKVYRIQEMGPKVVVLTKGGEGASALIPGGEIVEMAAQRVDVVDTVGAGDSFNAGILSKLLDKGLLTKNAIGNIEALAMKEALEHATRVAAFTVSRSGANPPWFHELAGTKR